MGKEIFIMEIRHLKTFKAIVDLGSFNKAAQYLGYAQSTITFHIKSIEDELGNPVFERIGKKVFLTEKGKLLLPHVIKMLYIYRDLKEATSIRNDINGELVISAPEALLIYRLPPVIKEYKEKYPNVDIKLKHLQPLKLKTELTQGDIDLAFILDTTRQEEGVYFEKLVTEPMMLISKNFISLNEKDSLKNRTFLFTEKGCSYRKVFQKLIDQNIDRQSDEIHSIDFWNIDALKECVINGLGIRVLPYITIKKELNQKIIYAQEIMAYHEDKWISPSLKAFINLVRKFAQEWEIDFFKVSR